MYKKDVTVGNTKFTIGYYHYCTSSGRNMTRNKYFIDDSQVTAKVYEAEFKKLRDTQDL